MEWQRLVQHGSDIDGESIGDRAVSLSRYLPTAASSPLAPPQRRPRENSGHVRIFDLSIPTIAISSDVLFKSCETAE